MYFRPEVLTDDPDDFRNVPVEIWYPATESSESGGPFFPNLDRVAQNLAASGEVASLEVFGLGLIKSHGILNASIPVRSSPYPAVILSPGQRTTIEFYAGIAEELDSYGYIVVGINHPYDVAAVEIIDDPKIHPGFFRSDTQAGTKLSARETFPKPTGIR